jgi:hypothetical protein
MKNKIVSLVLVSTLIFSSKCVLAAPSPQISNSKQIQQLTSSEKALRNFRASMFKYKTNKGKKTAQEVVNSIGQLLINFDSNLKINYITSGISEELIINISNEKVIRIGIIINNGNIQDIEMDASKGI